MLDRPFPGPVSFRRVLSRESTSDENVTDMKETTDIHQNAMFVCQMGFIGKHPTAKLKWRERIPSP